MGGDGEQVIKGFQCQTEDFTFDFGNEREPMEFIVKGGRLGPMIWEDHLIAEWTRRRETSSRDMK